MTPEERSAQLLHWVDRDNDAHELIMGAWNLANVWDDAHDLDKVRSRSSVNRAFQFALFDIHENRTYQRHSHLRSVLRLCALNWWTATELEKSGDPEKLAVSFSLRCSNIDFILAIIQAVAPNNAPEASLSLRGDTTDTFASYLAHHRR
jgi:hypothetical protein